METQPRYISKVIRFWSISYTYIYIYRCVFIYHGRHAVLRPRKPSTKRILQITCQPCGSSLIHEAWSRSFWLQRPRPLRKFGRLQPGTTRKSPHLQLLIVFLSSKNRWNQPGGVLTLPLTNHANQQKPIFQALDWQHQIAVDKERRLPLLQDEESNQLQSWKIEKAPWPFYITAFFLLVFFFLRGKEYCI